MSHLTEDQLNDFRANLEAERDSLEEEMGARGREVGTDWQGSSASKGTEADPTDAADNIEELATNIPVVEEMETRRKQIDKALERMDEGKYGTCTVCKAEIPLDRLEANPAAVTCISHA